ncbi:O-antigen ligase family protein [Lacinutrix mariniflava]|uniref:O-antigen ligase family protein n=1 Tax=Lacinutrix mariniflava TaxID=342955 RepID=UPI0006E2BEF9|nr:O-antigen ligase family protein [Lacinutrix mariniflava]
MNTLFKKTSNVNYVIIFLYLMTLFVPSLGAFDFAATQWFYIGTLNVVVFLYYLFAPGYLAFTFPKHVKLFFGIQIMTFIVSCLSMTQSIIIDESILYLSRIFTFIFSVFNLYIVFRDRKFFSFFGLSLIISVILFIESFEVVSYFYSKSSELRTHELMMSIPHRYGNRNILATAIVIKLPFLLFVFQQLKGFRKNISLIVVLFVITSLFLIGARTAAVIMAIVLVVFSIAYFVISKYSIQRSVNTILPLVIVAFIAYGFSISINRIYKDKLNSYVELFFTKAEKDLYNPKGKSNLVDGSGRKDIWNSAITDFKKSPIIGVGVGNWRHNSKISLYLNRRNKGVVFSTHVHNDYLQSLAETGIIGFLLYISIYIICFITLIKHYYKAKTDTSKFIIISLALALLSYMIDAFFNFPHHRAPIQIVFALVLAIILGFSNNNEQVPDKLKINKVQKALGYSFVVLLLLNVITHYIDYKASTVQYELMREVKSKDAFTLKYKYSYNQVIQMLPSFPYVNQIGMTNDDIKGLFAINNKKYDKALLHLNNSISNVENNLWPKTLKAMMFNFIKKEDSAFAYSKEVFDVMPCIESNFYILQGIYKKQNDTIALFDLYDRHFMVRPDHTVAWLNMCNDIRKYYRDNSLSLSKVNYALESYPYDKELISFKSELVKIMSNKSKSDIAASKLGKNIIDEMTEHFKTANNYFDQKDYTNARIQFLKVLELEPNNLPTHFKLGLLENLTKNYKDAIPYFTKVINDKYLNNGRPEYSRGVSYLKLKDNANAKKDFIISRNKNWPAALKLNDAFFK